VETKIAKHDQLVTGLDWAPEGNRIVSCAQDRNAYVWNYVGNTWEPTLVLLRLNRAATCVKWSPKENKFAVGSSAKTICVCYFEQENNWWVSKQIKKPIQSTVLSVEWHPNNLLVAAGCADMKARVFAAYVKDVDEKANPAPWAEGKLTFGQALAEYENGVGGWVHAVAFSPSGGILAWASHGSSVSIADPAAGTVDKVEIAGLPFVTLMFASEDVIICAGHDCYPAAITKTSNGWKYGDKLDGGEKKVASGGSGSVAMNMFKQMDSRAQVQSGSGDGISLNSVHQNTITYVHCFLC
jgi:actin related protein 2/3 complex subunit 1A/1B